jgi:hypothetical protein
MSKSEFLIKYGDVKVIFSSYYKYTFSFRADLEDGKTISVQVGGNADDIYREGVDANVETKISDLCPYGGSVFKDGAEIEGFYDY